MSDVEKPWQAQKRDQLSREKAQLEWRRSYLWVEIESINKRLVTIATEISDTFDHQHRWNPDYGQTSSPIDYMPQSAKLSPRGLIRGFKSKLTGGDKK